MTKAESCSAEQKLLDRAQILQNVGSKSCSAEHEDASECDFVRILSDLIPYSAQIHPTLNTLYKKDFKEGLGLCLGILQQG